MFIFSSFLIISLCSVLLGNADGSETCGSKFCKEGQVCESGVDGGTCYNSTSRIDCDDGISYCYKPRICCGVSTCCPENSECCGLNKCCPKGAVCCGTGLSFCCESGSTCCGFETCCARGSTCEAGLCKRQAAPFRWWYIFFFLFPLLAVIGVIVRRRRRAAMLRASGVPAGMIVTVPVQTRGEQYGYDQGPINYAMPPTTNMAPPRPSAPSGAPPAYSEVANPQA